MAIVVRNSMMTCQPSLEFQASLGLWRCFVIDEKGWDEFQLMLAEPRSQLPVPPVDLPSLCGLPCLPRLPLVMPPVPFLVLSHGWVFVTEGLSVVLTVLVVFQEGLNDGVLVGMFHVEMSVCEPEVDCSKGVQCVDVMFSVCYVAMLVPPQVSLDVGPAPCEAGPAGYGYALASLVEWHTLGFQISVCAAMMAAVKFVDVMVSVCYVAMLMPPQVSLDVGPAPCVAGPAGIGYALALVEWHTLRFQPIFVCAAMMAADGVNLVTMDCENMMLELASRLAFF